MKDENIKDQVSSIYINHRSIVPIYQQLSNQLLEAIRSGDFQKDELMPSIHELCISLEISKGSVEKAYEILKQQGIVGSVKGKGYYLKDCFLSNNDRE